MTAGDPPRLDAYRFHRKEQTEYDRLVDTFEWEIPDRFNIADYVCDRWAGTERIAIHAYETDESPRAYTFDDLRTDSDRLASSLEDEGIGAGDRVGVLAPQRPETLTSLLAVWKLGAVAVPLTTAFGPEAIEYRLADCAAAACIVTPGAIDAFRAAEANLEELSVTLIIGDVSPTGDECSFEAVLDAGEDEYQNAETAPDDDAMIIYTSGTTGPPKGVCHTHDVLLGHLPTFATAYSNLDVLADDIYWAAFNWASIGAFGMVFPALFHGRPVVADVTDAPFDPERAYDILDTLGVTSLLIAPTAIRMLMQVENPTGRWDLEQVRIVSSGGESVGETIADWVDRTFDGAVFHESYGQTEANVVIAGCTAAGVPHRPGKIGKPTPGHDVTIVDPESAEAIGEPGETGEIAVRYGGDPVCFDRYLDAPEKTAAKVQNGWLLTGDLGRTDNDGYVEFLSRKDNVIISSGYRIGPEEVEDSLSRHKAVADAGVLGVDHEVRGQVPKAFVVLTDGYEPSERLKTNIRESVKERLARYEYPREIEFVDELPKTATNKIARSELRAMEEGSS